MNPDERIRVMYPGSLCTGGAERQQLLLAEHLPRVRFDVSFVVSGLETPMCDEARRLGATVHVLGARRRRDVGAIRYGLSIPPAVGRYVRICRRERYDIVDAWLHREYGLAAVTRPLTRVPVLIAGRRSLVAYKESFSPVTRAVDAASRRSVDVIVANSVAVAEDVVAREGIAATRIRIIRNGVVIPPLPSADDRAALRSRMGVDDQPVVGCVGTFKPGKGQGEAVEVIAEVARVRPEVWLVFVGDGPELDSVRQLTQERGLDRVRFLGQVTDARALYPAFDMLLSMSEAEGLPNGVLEAAAAGLPVVASAAGGTVEVVIDGETGFLSPIGDVASSVRSLLRLLADPALATRMGQAAREHAGLRFGIDRLVSETAQLYEEMHARAHR